MRVVNTDNFGGGYPNEKFVSKSMNKEDCEALAKKLNTNDSEAARYFKVVEDDYKLQPGFKQRAYFGGITLKTREKALLDKSLEMVNGGKKIKVSAPMDLPPGVVMLRDGSFRVPKTAAQLADLLYRTREMRLDISRRVERLEALESQLKNYFVENLPKSNASGISGLVARVQIETKPIPQVEDWDKFYAYVHKHKAFDLFQRRIAEGAAKERMDEGKKIPGVGIFNVKKVNCTKL